MLAIGWYGYEELAEVKHSEINNIAGFLVLVFVLNFLIRRLAYLLFLSRLSWMRRVDVATVRW
ncbi:hypothetical protein [Mycobacterium lepromatosis]|uniref:hypothetical protein n=1 Tax=Mycobacterium lepromatosis TaxID=480418 RepID=UPI0009E4AD6C